ncbi:MAG TPA: hypothetical protein VNA20_10895 [Frankiaceae bacterium]|nr:hypothetical protein [Frankiaceae bacterium]
MTGRFGPYPLTGGRIAAALVAALAATALTAPAAFAGSTHHGRCSFQPFNQDQVTGSSYGGFVHAAVTVRSDDIAANPASATVTCYLRTNAVVDPWTVERASGTGVVVVLGRVTFWWSEEDTVEVCTDVDFADATPTATECVPLVSTQIPPQIVFDTVDAVLTQVWGEVDPRLCPLLAQLAPGYGDVAVNEQGDVHVAGEPVWDCPPYDIWP